MKFLCVPCDSPMKLQAVRPPERGSLSVVYECPECGYEMAMLTNPFETQLVQSLGVRVGPEVAAGAANAGGGQPGVNRSSAGAAGVQGEAGGKCPFGAMLPAMEGALEGARPAISTGGEAAGSVPAGGEPVVGADSPSGAAESIAVRWTSAAEARLANIPSFVRPMARTGIERFARERGAVEVDETLLDAARDFFGM